MVHVVSDVYRHAGHADVIRELIDGAVGAGPRWSNMPQVEETFWTKLREKVAEAARRAEDAPSE